MANLSDYMKNRLLQKSEEKATNARRALLLVTIYAAISGVLLLTYKIGQPIYGISNLLFAFFYFSLWEWSKKKLLPSFRTGMIVSTVIAFLCILSFRIFPAFIFSMVTYFIYIGIDGAKYLASQAPAVVEDENILDANLWQEEES